MGQFAFWPQQASTQAARVDAIFILLLVFRRHHPARHGAAARLRNPLSPRLHGTARRAAEFRQPRVRDRLDQRNAVLFLFLFWWAGRSQLSAWRRPQDAIEIHVVAKQWMWKTQHPRARAKSTSCMCRLDTPVRLLMTSQDVIHCFFVPAFRIKQDVVPGRYTETWFTATRPGVFHLFCAEYLRHRPCAHARPHRRHAAGRLCALARRRSREADDLAREGARAVRRASAARAATRRRPECTRPSSTASTAARSSGRRPDRRWPTRPICAIPSCCRSRTSPRATNPSCRASPGSARRRDDAATALAAPTSMSAARRSRAGAGSAARMSRDRLATAAAGAPP